MALDRISGLGPYGDSTINNNSKRVQSREGAEDTGEFTLLKDEAEGVLYEPGKPERETPRTLNQVRQEIAAEERAAALENLHSRFDGPGVTVELSNEGVTEQANSKDRTILGAVKDIFAAIGAFFARIWNGGEQGTAASADATDSSGEKTGEIYGDENADPGQTGVSYDTGDVTGASYEGVPGRPNTPEAAVAFLADYGGAHLAKNSDLLTQYDRTGHIVSMDPSDKRRILHGEGRVRRY